MTKYQQGVGLIEVLVSLILLAIGVIGFIALQMRAISSSAEASQIVLATNLAHDLSERMRMNRDGFKFYGKTQKQVESCLNVFCNAEQMATYDFDQVNRRAIDLGMSIKILDCPGAILKRQCVYVAWGTTTATNNESDRDCTKGTAYAPKAQCIIVETYNYE
ncbi:type IV pilus modification protein PilV [Acinetobacter lanii]|uniref:Type IV pilus modification protein PilV n=1 Tax=Acinetobacter lanii TaxID=2715163 RepID=A0A6G8S6V1_9GAMM|nr:type IV pilus modification protein PilV [Acinetobacter lanii]QIO09966.1 type IV pilus modification protein PilV [Acinetobacter lanii]